ncbi:dolichyl-diphosphooligosaccharide-protein glycosyltransferase [Thelephora ganbajun]|uniref:Dolichyl-diphosphooligosaccharide-protein glycosyltransferase n=1 Tax=Thelephora ganbajun TaxID=370292 RepID=A0ACB6ZWV0_THEGA|nr:dolichyl-diphosphooligosaccharide-protein glycosyltransferase [Thelephora ganbajun]
MFSLYLILAAFIGLLQAKSSTGGSVLVILDNKLNRSEYSLFFGGLEDQGYSLTFRAPGDSTPAIKEYDAPNFNHIIVFAPHTKNFSSDITPQSLVSLLEKGTNLLLALSQKQNLVNSLASEFSLILPPPQTPLVSHFPEREEPATVIPIIPQPNILVGSDLPPVWFSGIPVALGNNPLLFPILRAPAESLASDATADSGADSVLEAVDRSGEGLWAGSSLSLVTGFQTRNGARATWVGGVEPFSDDFAKKNMPSGKKPGNARFCNDVAAWTFQEKLVLRIDAVSHHKLGGSETPEIYTTNDQIVYTAHISKYEPATSSWVPYSGISDLQLEFTMLDPHIRISLPPVADTPGKYSVTFRAPDRHGVFKFVIDHRRKGWSTLQSSTTIPVVPPRHDGYPRFLSAAWPYYTGAISTSVGFLLFSLLWLAGGEEKAKTKKE